MITLIGIVSAYTTYGGNLDPRNFFYAVGEENLALAIVFIVAFVMIDLPLKKVFQGETAAAAVIAAALATGVSYFFLKYGYAQMIGDFIFNLGFSVGIPEGSLYTLIFILAVALLVILTWITTISWALITIGVLMILLSSYAYESDVVTLLGAGLIIAAIGIGWIRHYFQNSMYMHGGGGWLRGRVMRPGIFGLLSRRRN